MLNHNKIVKIKENVFPPNLRELDLSFNKIVELKENVFPLNLQELDLDANEIVELKENVFPINLVNLILTRNEIEELKENVFPINLQKLLLCQNKIVELKENVFPINLQRLTLFSNKIEELPLHLLNLRRLTYIFYRNNPIKNISLPVQRWLYRLGRRNTDNNKVYSDNQNIHNSNIQRSFRQSLENIMRDEPTSSLEECKQELLDSNLTEEVKREIINYCDDETEHSFYLITFGDLFHYVMNRIIKHKDKEEILKILQEEIKDTICKCFTGRMIRLLNVLNEFYDDINIQIGTDEQITNVILMLKEKYDGIELRDKVRCELEERGYDKDVIEEWISFIE